MTCTEHTEGNVRVNYERLKSELQGYLDMIETSKSFSDVEFLLMLRKGCSPCAFNHEQCETRAFHKCFESWTPYHWKSLLEGKARLHCIWVPSHSLQSLDVSAPALWLYTKLRWGPQWSITITPQMIPLCKCVCMHVNVHVFRIASRKISSDPLSLSYSSISCP